MSNPNERTEAVGTSRDLFCIHAEVPANKREGRDPSCSRGIAIYPHFVQLCASMQHNGSKQMSNPNEMTKAVGTSRDLFCIHAEVLANKREGRDHSRSMTNKAVSFIQARNQQHAQYRPRQMSNPNEMTDAVGTNPDLSCIHAKVPANKKEGRDPSRS